MTADAELDAGDFSSWLDHLRRGLRGEGDVDVPCGECTACCTSAQFVHVGADELDSIAHIPAELLFPAPGWPKGTQTLGYDEHGRCPMFVESRCSIYPHRPRACRTYDCRIFSATALHPDGQPDIARQADRWRFSASTAAGRQELDRVRAAARSLRDERRSASSVEVALRALQPSPPSDDFNREQASEH